MTALRWHKSSYSANTGPQCVEVAETRCSARVRDTQHRHLGHLEFPTGEWQVFLGTLRGEAEGAD
ncbi:DUF397 domain-containing protein [Nocardiopsis suaedae]|uniref:DUF397 domain-containing protein n=1 Tax=Nocardiopsis suaedae TaxID=3018444 RepID=A0ABT4TIM7_9ACTN|nr:DUF397 domain-containing protein [Nocardiopsis suaedae]MDA2804260.1 DUF397 domain-containing protein [Nocardiopsis suaedae]